MAAKLEKEERMVQVFAQHDRNGDGELSIHEVKLILKALGVPKKEVDKIFDQVFRSIDVNRDGRVSYKEFVHWLFSSSQKPEHRCKAPADIHAKALHGQVQGVVFQTAVEALDDFMEKVDDFMEKVDEQGHHPAFLDHTGHERGMKPTMVTPAQYKNYYDYYKARERQMTVMTLRGIFDYIDGNGSGHISLTEFVDGAKRLGLGEARRGHAKAGADMHFQAKPGDDWLHDIFLLLDHAEFDENFQEKKHYTPAQQSQMREVAIANNVGPPLFNLKTGCADPRSRYHICAFVEEEVLEGEGIAAIKTTKYVYDPNFEGKGDHSVTWPEFQTAFLAAETARDSVEEYEAEKILAEESRKGLVASLQGVEVARKALPTSTVFSAMRLQMDALILELKASISKTDPPGAQ